MLTAQYVFILIQKPILLVVDDDLVSKGAFYALIPFVIMFSFVFFVFYRRNRENELRKTQLDLELKALRAQTNPHFIFNCLNSIYHCIDKNEQEVAKKYLVKFSFLLRRVLENSSHRWISLEEELSMLNAYLDLEQLRTGFNFRYQVEVDPKLDPLETLIPMLITQPFVENSIWHGFDLTQSNNILSIFISAGKEQLLVSIEDNGAFVVATEKEVPQGKTRSMGKSLIEDQLKAIRELEKSDANYRLETIFESGKAAGTRVIITLPLLNLH
jgi:LytS/YehU family sensor histidine kinase